jgi:hypothetical protein
MYRNNFASSFIWVSTWSIIVKEELRLRVFGNTVVEDI